jgi:hypothetical protein
MEITKPAGNLESTGSLEVTSGAGPDLQIENIVEAGRDRHVFASDVPTHSTVYDGRPPEAVLNGMSENQANEVQTGGHAGPMVTRDR